MAAFFVVYINADLDPLFGRWNDNGFRNFSNRVLGFWTIVFSKKELSRTVSITIENPAPNHARDSADMAFVLTRATGSGGIDFWRLHGPAMLLIYTH